jgi:hypothetical protein
VIFFPGENADIGTQCPFEATHNVSKNLKKILDKIQDHLTMKNKTQYFYFLLRILQNKRVNLTGIHKSKASSSAHTCTEILQLRSLEDCWRKNLEGNGFLPLEFSWVLWLHSLLPWLPGLEWAGSFSSESFWEWDRSDQTLQLYNIPDD